MRGEDNPNWKGGKTVEERERIPFAAQIQQWRRRVFHRDGYTCQRCGLKPNRSGQLRAHHIAPWTKCPERRFDIDNGITLCDDCHRFVHSRKNASRELLSE